ncbi:hypothetical protein Ocin01_15575 [Orchesella cincta]|uniref:FAM192A/Fyv6 N-terminal domain-containing protein n=1 Tax=Orchesella cincta TaxID=48709 RepID=A0A1D2MDL7_ORCCI|nr:hypothetical protein Ocin01_15575 [Orchesella cincta]
MSSGFITESEIEQQKQVRQAEWEKVRKPEDPVAAPEGPAPDNRSLFDRLQEQKMKKQEEFEESHKLKNLVKGLDDDEADFLEYVDKAKMDQERKKRMEELKELSEFRSKMAELRDQELDKHIKQELGLIKTEKKVPKKSYDDDLPSIGTGKTTQSKLLAGIVKRKAPCSQSTPPTDQSAKVPKLGDDGPKEGASTAVTSKSETEVDSRNVIHSVPYKGSLVCIGVLPGLGSYSDSSNSDDDSSDSERDGSVPRDLCGREIVQAEDEQTDGKKKK